MRSLDVNWAEFIEALSAYRRLSVPAREQFIRNGPYSAPIRADLLREFLREYQDAGLFSPTSTGRTMVLAPRFRGLAKALRAMHRSRIDTKPGVESLDAYLADNFSREEWTALYADGGYWYRNRDGLYPKIASVSSVENFLRSGPQGIEAQASLPLEPGLEAKSRQQDALRRDAIERLTKALMQTPAPLAFEELAKVIADRELLAWAITAGIRCAVMFPMLRRKTLDPVLGLWPEVSARLHRPAPAPAAIATPAHSFNASVLVDDIVAVLTACMAEPLRLMANASEDLYQKSEKQVAARLLQLPDWLTAFVKINEHTRIRNAIWRLRLMDMMEAAGRPGNDYRLEVTARGKTWLALSAKERLKGILDRVRNHDSRDDGQFGEWEALAPHIRIDGRALSGKDAIAASFGRLPAGRAVLAFDFAAYESRVYNPLASGRKNSSRIVLGHNYLNNPSEEELERVWFEALSEALFGTLMLLGAVEVGVTAENQMTAAAAEVGRYLFGLAGDFSLETAESAKPIVVQPNFEIVFMIPSPLAEAELSGFTERQGKHVGSVLRITKRSVWTAAAAGIGAEQVIQALARHASVALPANVEREIRGWMAQCRRASLRSAIIIHCPDADTASRALSAERGRLAKLSDTVLELTDTHYRSKLVKKLREAGIFV